MSHTLSLRGRFLAAFLLPATAIGFVAATGVLESSRDLDRVATATATFNRAEGLQSAAVAVADERIAHALAAVPADPDQPEPDLVGDAALATDTAMDRLAEFGDEVVVEQAWNAISAARATPVGRADSYSRATATLLARSEELSTTTGSAEAGQTYSQLAAVHRFLEAEDLAWLGFVDRNSEDLRSSASVLQSFAVAAELRRGLETADSPPIADAMAATRVMNDLRSTAIEDVLNSEQMLVPADSALLSHVGARARWITARDLQATAMADQVAGERTTAEDHRNQAALFGILGLFVLAMVGVGLYQSVTGPIEAAAAEARSLLATRLPVRTDSAGVERLSSVRPRHLSQPADDELGQLVTAMNTVQDRFYDIADREVKARRQMSGRTVTIAARNASLLHELVRNVSAWRTADTSSDVRRRLFAIDHIATRMQRNIEAGLVLGGGRSERRWTKPISAMNTARLALGEVTEFDRVDVSQMVDVRLHGLVAPDIAHVLAELIDNALAASAEQPDPRDRVTVEGEWVAAGWAFIVNDSGEGMDAAERDRINRTLHTPSLSHEGSTRSLGITLVSRTAARFGIDVRLIERGSGGTTARIVLPVDLIDPETVPADRKPIDAGRGATPDRDPNWQPADNQQLNAADAYFGPETEPDSSPLEAEHDVNAELRKLTGESNVIMPPERPEPTGSAITTSES